jgi:beta-N-acetylhexosaminidase
VPFRSAVDAGARAIMTAHLVVPALDDRPATVSRALLTELLRYELGFTGAVVTDALDMHGIGGPDAIPANVVRALAAGADLCCLGSGATDALVDACVETVVGALRSGALTMQRLAEAAGRVAAIALPPVDGPAGDALADLEKLGAEAARRALRVEGLLPRSLAGAHVVEVRRPVNIAAGVVPARLGGPWQALDPSITHVEVAPGDPRPPLPDRPLVVVVRDVQTLAGGPELLDELVAERPDAVVVDLGWPAGDGRVAQARVSTFGASRAGIAAVAELLASGGRAGG